MVALSVKPCWAWLIVKGWKTIENRTRSTERRGTILIHATIGMTREDYRFCRNFISDRRRFGHLVSDVPLPRFEDLPRGGIIGQTDIIDCVTGSDDAWYTGPFGWVLKNARELPYQSCAGALGFFTPTIAAA